MPRPKFLDLLVPFLLAAAVCSPASSMTVVPLTDAELVDRTPLIVVARAEGPLAFSPEGLTDWQFTVERVLKGDALQSSLIVRLPGGQLASGDFSWIPGTPTFSPGRRALLFLSPLGGDLWSIPLFSLGVFHQIAAPRGPVAIQNLSDTRVLSSTSRRIVGRAKLRDFEAFSDWISDVGQGIRVSADYLRDTSRSEMKRIVADFTLLPDLFFGTGRNIRWYEFDSSGTVYWRNAGVQPGIASGGSTEFFNALNAWTNEGTTPVRLAYAGATTNSLRILGPYFDGRNAIVFNDPFNEVQDIDQSLCKGVLGLGVAKGNAAQKSTFNGRSFIRIREADIVINNGIECFLNAPGGSKFLEELFAHELGHTLGIGHSSMNEFESNPVLRDAQMYYLLHNDGRGARFNSDDIAALQALYRKGSGGVRPSPKFGPARVLVLARAEARRTRCGRSDSARNRSSAC
jgi:hypothetical protein